MGQRQSTLANDNTTAAVDPTQEEVFKIVLFGDVRVGKSCLIKRFLFDTFDEEERPWRCVEPQTKLVTSSANGRDITLQIWDTKG